MKSPCCLCVRVSSPINVWMTELIFIKFGMYEGKSVNMSEMDRKRKTCDIQTWKRTFISRHILYQHWYTLIALPVRRNPQHRSLSDSCLSHFRTSVSTSSSLREFLDPVVNRFTRQTLPTVNRKHFFMNILCIESSWPPKTHNRTLLFGSICLKHGRHFDYWNQLLNLRMRVCYLVIHTESITSITAVLLPFMTHLLTLGYHGTWAHVSSVLHKSLPSDYVSIYVHTLIVAMQWLDENVAVTTNTHETIQELLDA
jgi:hypothetical protein